MKQTYTITKAFLIAVSISVVLTAAPAMGLTDEEIFTWVTSELNIQKPYEMPKIQYVTKDRLAVVFRKNNERSLKRWASTYGEEKASEMLDVYLQEVIGLFIPQTGDLYVGNFLEPCKKESIVAHELTHYIQLKEKGPIDPTDRNAANIHLYNEMQAGNIERIFTEKFCSPAS